MESPSAPAHRQLVPWQELLLAGSLLIFWSLPITQQLLIKDLDAPEGKDALLDVKEMPSEVGGFKWFKGERIENENLLIGTYIIASQTPTSGPANNSRQIICGNGSLLFLKTIKQDTGSYTLQVIKKTFKTEKATGLVRVFPELPTPTLTTDNTNPEEDKDHVMFKCEPLTVNTTYRWLIDNQTHPKSSKLENVFTLKPVTRRDTGTFQCETRNPVSVRLSNTINLNVLYGPDAPIITPTDFQYYPGANLSLSCNAFCNPPAEYTWIFHGKPLQHTPELFIPHITAKESGSYTCLAHNPVTGLNRTADQNIAVSVLTDKGIVGIVIGVLVGLAVIAALVCALFLRNTRRASDQCDLTQPKPSASNHSQGHSDNSPNKINEVTYSSLNFNVQESKKPTSASPSPKATKTVFSEVKKKLTALLTDPKLLISITRGPLCPQDKGE